MGDEFSAGSISVDLRSEFENLATGILQGQQKLDQLGTAIETQARRIKTSSDTINASFQEIDLHATRLIDRFIRMTAGLAATQIALESLHGQKGLSGLQIAFEAAAKGLQSFIVIFNSFPGVAGGVLGGLAAIIAGYNVFTRAIDDAQKAQEKLNKELDKNIARVISARAKADVKAQLEPTFQAGLATGIEAYTEQLERADEAVRKLAAAEATRDALGPSLVRQQTELNTKLREMEDLDKEIAKYNFGVRNPQIAMVAQQLDEVTIKLRDLNRAVDVARQGAPDPAKVDELAAKIRNLKEALDFTKTELQARKLVSAMQDIQVEGERAVALGIDTPLQAAKRDFQATEAALRKLIAAEEDLKKAMALTADSEEVQRAIRGQLIQTQESTAAISVKAQIQKANLEAQQAATQYAQGLARSIGDAVAQGILNGEKAMDILANVGRNLLSNMLNNLVDQFQKGMVAAFQSIAGQGGEILGGALTAILGVVGGVLSRRRSGNQSFAGIQPQVTSSEAVRGIVAGPTNVAIAAVGEDIQRANRPVVERLDRIAGLLASIDSKTGGAIRSAFSAPAVSVPTA